MHRRHLILVLTGLALVVGTPAATGSDPPTTPEQSRTLQGYAQDTWRSFDMLLYRETGLPADNVSAEGVRSRYTSPTNIGAYMWSTIVARDVGLIKPAEARTRIETTLTTLARIEKHEWSGQYYNWYDPQTGTKLTTWPVDGSSVAPFLSSVDNGWLATALKVVREAVPQLRRDADAILDEMDFGFYYDPQAGLLRGGFWDTAPGGCSTPGTYRGMHIVPSWGGSMVEALMVPLFVPEEDWAPRSWGVNHPLYVRAQIEHGLQEAAYGYWGFSPSNNPDGGYREYGVDPIGLEPNGYASDQERTHVDYGFEPCRPGAPPPAAYGRGVVTPHASFLALEYDRAAALANLAKLRSNFAVYGSGGFFDAVDVKTGTVSRFYLALDQGMVMAALGNELRNDRLRDYFTRGEVTQRVRPVIAPEEFTAG